MSLNDLCESLTKLSKDDIAILRHYDSILQSIAELNKANIFIDCLTNAPDSAVVISEAKPRGMSSYNNVNWVGKIIRRKDEPGVFETLISGKPTYNILGVATLKELGNFKEKIQIYSSTVPIKNSENNTIGCLIMEKDVFEEFEKKYQFESITEDIKEFSEIMLDVTTKNGVFINIMDEGFFVLKFDGKITYANTKATNLFHKINQYKEIKNISISQLFDEKFDFKKIANDKHCRIYEFMLNNMELQLKTIPIWNDNSLKGAICVIKDITDIKEKEKELVLKSTLIQEIHHRVKNDFQTISGLLRMQSRRTDNFEVKEIINESINRIMSVALIYEVLSRNGTEQINLTDLIESVLKINNNNVYYISNNIEWKVSGEVFFLDCDRATTLALVINELVQNALEHAFINKDKGMINITILSLEDKHLRITFRDDGVGFDEKKINKQGLGLQIVKMLVKEKLKGTIEFKDDNGTYVSILFKI